jgi:hypothetical protein
MSRSPTGCYTVHLVSTNSSTRVPRNVYSGLFVKSVQDSHGMFKLGALPKVKARRQSVILDFVGRDSDSSKR